MKAEFTKKALITCQNITEIMRNLQHSAKLLLNYTIKELIKYITVLKIITVMEWFSCTKSIGIILNLLIIVNTSLLVKVIISIMQFK